MKVIMLSPTLPWPLNMGSKIRIYHVLKELARAGHEVTLLALAHEPYTPEDLEALRPYCKELRVVPVEKRSRLKAALKAFFSLKPYRVAKFESPEFKKQVARALGRDYDILWVHFMETLAYLPQRLVEDKTRLVVVDQHNADELMWSRFIEHGSLGAKLFAMWNLSRLRHFQREVMEYIDVLLEVSREETEFMRQHVPSSVQVWTVPNGVDIDHFHPNKLEKETPVILFCGGLDRASNIDAVTYFAKEIFPLVRKYVPEAQFWIVGRDPTHEVLRLSRIDGVQIFSNPKDIRPYYEKAKITVAPFRLGGGTKLKILESFAMGVPIITVPIHGIDEATELHLLIGKDKVEFANHVIDLLTDEDQRLKMARAGLQLARTRYSWPVIMRDVEERIRKVCEGGKLS